MERDASNPKRPPTANWGPYREWFLVDQQGPIAVRKIYEEIEGTLQ